MPWLRSRVERASGLTTWSLEWREGGRGGKVRARNLGPVSAKEAQFELAAMNVGNRGRFHPDPALQGAVLAHPAQHSYGVADKRTSVWRRFIMGHGCAYSATHWKTKHGLRPPIARNVRYKAMRTKSHPWRMLWLLASARK